MNCCIFLSAIVLAVVAQFSAGKVCHPICPAIWAPVCGTDGKTYSNQCELEAKRDCNNVNVQVAYQGACKTVRSTEELEIQCVPRMRSGACTREYMPICGSDGKTYGNRCTFCYAMYMLKDQGKELKATHLGQCSSIEASISHEKCPPSSEHGVCTDEYNPVCASDGKTYPTHCRMCVAMYQKQKEGENIHLHVVHKGKCEETAASVPECLPREKKGICTFEYMPVCGSDGVTRPNKCSLCFAMAQAETEGKELTMLHKGKCVSARASSDDECPADSKNGICTLEYAPVCASDGKTYSNHCFMCAAMYAKQEQGENCHLTVVKHGEC